MLHPTWLSLTSFQGCYHHMSTFPSKGLVLHSMIWVWNGPNFMLSFMMMGLSISWPCEASGVVAPSLVGMLPASGNSQAAIPHWHNKRKACTIAQGVDNLSNSLSFMTLTILPSMHIPIMRRMHLENSLIWDHKENDVFIIISNLTDLDSQDHKAKRPHPPATQPY